MKTNTRRNSNKSTKSETNRSCSEDSTAILYILSENSVGAKVRQIRYHFFQAFYTTTFWIVMLLFCLSVIYCTQTIKGQDKMLSLFGQSMRVTHYITKNEIYINSKGQPVKWSYKTTEPIESLAKNFFYTSARRNTYQFAILFNPNTKKSLNDLSKYPWIGTIEKAGYLPFIIHLPTGNEGTHKILEGVENEEILDFMTHIFTQLKLCKNFKNTVIFTDHKHACPVFSFFAQNLYPSPKQIVSVNGGDCNGDLDANSGNVLLVDNFNDNSIQRVDLGSSSNFQLLNITEQIVSDGHKAWQYGQSQAFDRLLTQVLLEQRDASSIDISNPKGHNMTEFNPDVNPTMADVFL